jgi:hypothetical protein
MYDVRCTMYDLTIVEHFFSYDWRTHHIGKDKGDKGRHRFANCRKLYASLCKPLCPMW